MTSEAPGRSTRACRIRLAVLIVAVLTVPLLAGCLGSGAGSGSTADSSGPKAGTNASAGNASGNRSPVSRQATDWVRDHWQGRDEVVLVDGTGQVSTGVSASQDGATGACTTPCEAAFFRPEEGKLVAPGTARLNVTVSWSEPPGMQIDLFYEPANGRDAPPVNDVPNGEPVTIPVNASRSDAPFQAASLWWFNLWPSADPGGAVPPTEVDLEVVAERSKTLPEIGPAPDRSNATGDVTLLDAVTVDYRIGVHPEPGCMGLLVSCHPPDPGAWWIPRNPALVPDDASTVRATLSWDDPVAARPGLDAIHPGGRVRMDLVEDDPTGMQRTFETTVPDEAVDSPWQQRSLWRFSAVFEEQGVEGGVSTGPYTLTATAIRGNETTG